jgi:hypothetical protein
MAFDAELYSSRFLMNLDRRTVARQITNDDYTVQGARTVRVYTAGDLSAQTKNADNTVQIQNPSGSVTPMTLDQEKDLTVGIGSVEEFQSQVDIQEKMRDRQAQAGEEDLDDFILGKHSSANVTLSTTASTASGFRDKIREAKVALSDNNVPRSGRWMVVSPHYADLITESASDQIDRNRDIELDGYIGRFQSFDIFESTGVVQAGGKEHLMFGHEVAITLAVQLNQVALVNYEDQASYHGDVLKALMVYGAKTFKPDALGDLEADIP